MARDWLAIIRAIAPKAKAEIAAGLAEAMPDIVNVYDVDTPLRLAHFLAQCAHESDGFHTTVEYASGDAYDTRTDMGFTAARDGDGRKFKGFGLIQETGPKNQRAAAIALGILKEWTARPRILADFPYAALSAAFFWQSNRCNALADRDDVVAVTKRVNGGTNGLADRKTYLARAKKALETYADGVEDVAPDIEPEGVILPRSAVKALQAALGAQYPLGTPDGIVGTLTVAAVSAFQSDNDLPVSGHFDAATIAAINKGVPARPVVPSRANGKPAASKILSGAKSLKIGALGMIGTAGANIMADPVTSIEKASGYYSRIRTAMEPFASLEGVMAAHWPLLLIVVAVAVFGIAHMIEQARVADYQTGKTP